MEQNGEPAGTHRADPAARLERWQRRLLDLSLMNGLLNFRAGKRSVFLEAPEPDTLENRLAAGARLRFLPKPSPENGSEETLSAETLREKARAALERDQILVALEKDELEVRLTELYRAARLALSEGGANTLYVAFGFLAWKRDAKDQRRYKAPLLLLPATLERQSVRSGFRLALHDDEPRLNPTLVEMAKQDFALALPYGDGELPRDANGLDVAKVWRAIAEAVEEMDGWEVLPEVVLSTFSFAKYLMWKDLVDRTETLKENAVVRHLLETRGEAYPSDIPFPDPRALDKSHPPAKIFAPLPADSSQLAAIAAADSGKDFVLIGPPGTGKSQTIANMIAHFLGAGKRVLFVAEKTAALDVVHRRLKALGLGDFSLELHSAKARKIEVLNQLRRALAAKGACDEEGWRREARRLGALRDSLNLYVERLHKQHRNGLTPYIAIGCALAGRNGPQIELSWPSADAHDRDGLAALHDLAARLGRQREAAGEAGDSAIACVRSSDWSPSFQAELVGAAEALAAAAEETDAAERTLQSLGWPASDDSAQRAALGALARELPAAAGHDWRFLMGPDAPNLLGRLEIGATALRGLSSPYRAEALTLDLETIAADARRARTAWWPLRALLRRRVRQALTPHATGAGPNTTADAGLLAEIRKCGGDGELAEATGGLWAGLESDPDRIDAARRVHAAWRAAEATLAGASSEPRPRARRRRSSADVLRTLLERLLGAEKELLSDGRTIDALAAYSDASARLADAQAAFERIAGAAPDGSAAAIARACRRLVRESGRLRAWCAWRRAVTEAEEAGLAPLVRAIERGEIRPGEAEERFRQAYCRWWLDSLLEGEEEVLRQFLPAEHEQRIAEFRAVDERFQELTAALVRARLCARIPDENAVRRNPQWGILRRELEKKRRLKPLRVLAQEIPEPLSVLAPCLLMSPLSIAQYLAPGTPAFDVVIFDEASQIPVWDAIGALARGRQVVIVGDQKQLPPTSFFDRAETEEDDEEIPTDLESILDETLAAGLPTLSLSWHYRSRHESLIAFSNHRYYGGGLVTFPSPATNDRAVSLRPVADGLYEKGGARINKPEAKALVAELVGCLKDPEFVARGWSIGVVTFNAEQQRLIEDLLDAERRRDPALEPFFADDHPKGEPVFVKNLESVQGDERDVMFFSITYGPDRSGHVAMNFGPLNRDGGERRLNVAVTRARHELRVFSSIGADQIDLGRTNAAGVRDLKLFLDFAARGTVALAEAVTQEGGDYESPFEAEVAAALARRGWAVRSQIGVSSFRIDLGVVDPRAPGRYLAGIECDGATYHRAATARDRDKLRERVLRGLGWNILRIWSTDWWIDSASALDEIDMKLRALAGTEDPDVEDLRPLERAAAR